MRKFLLLLILLMPFTAHAEKPKEIYSYIQAKEAYGVGTYRWLFIEAYTATLWTDAKEWSYQAPFALSITYNMDFSRQDLVERSLEEIQAIHALPEAESKKLQAYLETAFRDVKKGERITAVFSPKKGATIYHQGRFTGAIPSLSLAQKFFDIWLSKNTSAPALRDGLLGRS